MTDQAMKDRVTALAAVFQAAVLVEQIANGETPPSRCLATSVNSLFALDAASVDAMLPRDGLACGREMLEQTLRRTATSGTASARIGYVMAMLHLNGILRDKPAMQATVRTRLQQLVEESPGLADRSTDDMLARVAALYVDTFGTLSFRVQVKGDPRQLQDPAVAARIRACLLAGVRAAHLWHHLGGRRWHLLFGARRMLAAL